MLQLEALSAGYGGGTALHQVSLDVAAGGVHAVAGINGAGKTTLLHTVAGLLRATSGRILLDGADITALPTHRRPTAGIALVPQGRRIFATLTVAEHLAIADRARQPRLWDQRTVLDLFPQLGRRLHHRGAQLSGGEQQMLAIARALLAQPRLLLADEPTEGLAPALAATVRDLIRPIAEAGTAILLATPTPELCLVADRVTILAAGRAVPDGRRPDAERLRAALTPGPATTTPASAGPPTPREPAWARLLDQPGLPPRTPPAARTGDTRD